jgi:hypothetical protein
MATNECLSLASSTACPMYAAYSIQSGELFQTIEEFDQLIQTRILNDLRKCAAFQNEGLRYHVSLGCSMLVFSAKGDCSSPPPVCQQFVNASLTSMSTFVKGACKTSIPLPVQRHLADSQAAGANCTPAVESETALCGFQTPEEQKQYCLPLVSLNSDFDEVCCESFKTNSTNSTVKLAPLKTMESSNIEKELKKDQDRYLGTAMVIFGFVSSTIGSIILATVIIFLILKREIQRNRRPLVVPQIPAKENYDAATRKSFYF